jgi:hypothetical protein
MNKGFYLIGAFSVIEWLVTRCESASVPVDSDTGGGFTLILDTKLFSDDEYKNLLYRFERQTLRYYCL